MEKLGNDLEELDQQLKKEINTEFDAFVKNRMLIDKLKKENDAVLQILAQDPHPLRTGHHNSHAETKAQRELANLYRNIYDMRSVIYQIVPEAKEAVHAQLHLKHASHAHDTKEEISFKRKTTTDVNQTGKPSLGSFSSVHHPKDKDGTSSHHQEGGRKKSVAEEDEDKSSVEHNKATRNQEVELILRYFNHDTNHIQDMVIAEMKGMDTTYEDKRYIFLTRFELLSLNGVTHFKKDLLKHYQGELVKAIKADVTAINAKIDREDPKEYEIDLRQRYEKKMIDNQFIFWQISSKIKAYIELKYVPA